MAGELDRRVPALPALPPAAPESVPGQGLSLIRQAPGTARRTSGPSSGFAALPESAVWRHIASRDGFEVAFLNVSIDGITLSGTSLGVEDNRPWSVDYVLDLDHGWVTRRAVVAARAGTVQRSVSLHSSGWGTWLVNGHPAPQLSGCVDVDLDVSALTNAVPLHRLRLDIASNLAALDEAPTSVPAVYVRARDLAVTRLEQSYRRRAGTNALVFDYRAPAFDFRSDITYDLSGLVLDYPGIAARVR